MATRRSGLGAFVVVSIMGAVALVGCSKPLETPTATATATATITETLTPSPTEGPEPDITPEPSNPEASQSSSPLQTDAAGVPLTLSDFFNVSDIWDESRYDIAGRSQERGIAANVSVCGLDPYDSTALELRLANHFKSLRFTVGQADSSDLNNQVLDVRVDGNGEQKDIWHVPFNKVQPFEVDVEAVNALVISFYLDPEKKDCGNGSVTAVLSDAVLE